MTDKDSIGPRSLPKQSRSAETVRAILEAAVRVLEKMKLDQSSTNQIAKIAGVSIGTLYQYFPNKESLAAMLIDRELENNVKEFEGAFAAMRDRSPRDLSAHLAEKIVRFYMQRKIFLRSLYEHVTSFAKIDKVMNGREILIQSLAKELEVRRDELKVTEFRPAAFVIIHSIAGLMSSVVFVEPLNMTEDELKTEVQNLIMGYLFKE